MQVARQFGQVIAHLGLSLLIPLAMFPLLDRLYARSVSGHCGWLPKCLHHLDLGGDLCMFLGATPFAAALATLRGVVSVLKSSGQQKLKKKKTNPRFLR